MNTRLLSRKSAQLLLIFLAFFIPTLCLTASAAASEATPLDAPPVYLPFVGRNIFPVTGSVAVLSSSAFPAGTSYLYVVGEIQNQTRDNVRFMRVLVTLKDANGAAVYTTPAPGIVPTISALTPGMKSPFVIIVTSPPAYTKFEVTVGQFSTTTEAPHLLEVVSASQSWDMHLVSYVVSGTARNNQAGDCSNVEAVLTLYNAQGKVIGVDHAPLTPDDLIPGQTATYKAEVSIWDGRPDTSLVKTHSLVIVDEP